MSGLHVKFGITPEFILNLYHDGTFHLDEEADLGSEGTWKSGQITEWSFILVRTVYRSNDASRLLLLHPSDESFDLNFHDFFVKGNAKISQKINNTRKAHQAWKKRKTLFPS